MMVVFKNAETFNISRVCYVNESIAAITIWIYIVQVNHIN